MLCYRKTNLVVLLTIGFSFFGFAQKSDLITGNFESVRFYYFARTIESTTSYHFFYDPTTLDSLTVNTKANNSPLADLLTDILKPTNLHFAIDKSGNVFIADKKFKIQTNLPDNLFAVTKPTTTIPIPEEAETESQQKINTSEENKLFEIGPKTSQPFSGSATLAGYIKDSKSGEGLLGASVYLDSSSIGVVTDQFGYFSLTLPRGRHQLRITSTGMKATKRQIVLHSDGRLNVEMREDIPTLKTVMVVAEKNSNVRRMQMGIERLTIKTIKQVPVLLGEPDVLRVILTLPGVTSVGEASTGFNVRGGSSDQNLVLFNDATIYNPSHLFGFFSSFNPDVIKNAELYKSSIPEKYGGRLSSVLDITTRDGNSKKWTGTAGIGLLTSKLTLEGPLDKDKTSILIGGRSTYSNWILRRLPGSDYSNSRASFYDVNLHLTHEFNSKNTLYVTGYMSEDQFRLNDDTTYKYGNKNVVAKWKHVFNNKLYMTLTGGRDQYQYSVEGDKASINEYKLAFDIAQFNERLDFSYAPNNNHQLSFGVTNINYKIQPGELRPVGKASLIVPEQVNAEKAMESAVYLGDKINLGDKLSVNVGVRYSMFAYLGPQKTYKYIDGLPRDESTVQDSSVFGNNKAIQRYHGPELRLALRYTLSENSSVKLSYNTLRQYIHLLSNTTAISPTDIWKLSDQHIKPQLGDQLSAGIYRDFKSNTIETSVEVYYKRIKNFLDYKSGASIVMNKNIERDVISTKGRAYGIEFLIRKSTGKLNGWISYTYSKIELQMDDSLAGQQINKGNYYPANFDKPHMINLVSNYKFTHRYSISFNVQYSTGRPITLPIAVFNLAGSQRVFYSERNQYRVPDYFRMDFAINIDGNHKLKQLTHGSWSVGLYNMTARKNPYSIYFVEENGVIKGYKLSVIGTVIPYVTYNVRF
ncbi:MAG: TonB-dependent receptor [Chitinophagaceae bacterium]|nr:TonB-dependent receptor [Chitinophagaceae bacterium]